MLYDLYKKVYTLNRNDKESLYNNWDDIVLSLNDSKTVVSEKKDKKSWYTIRRKKNWFGQIDDVDTKRNPDEGEYEYVEQQDRSDPWHETRSFQDFDLKKMSHVKSEWKRLAEIFDPETDEQMCHLLGLLEKFISVDNDISYDNVSVFLHPLSRGVKKISLRPYRMIGLVKELERLSKQFGREKSRVRNLSEDVPIAEEDIVFPEDAFIEIPAKEQDEPDPEILEMFFNALNAIKEKMEQKKTPKVHRQKNASLKKVATAETFAESIIKNMIDSGMERDDILAFFEGNPDFNIEPEEIEISLSRFFG